MFLKKEGKMSKGALVAIIIIACVAVLAIIGGIGFTVFSTANRTKNEVELTNEIISMYNSQKIDSNIKTSGKFATVEKGIKDYYTEYTSTFNDLKSLYSQNLLKDSLSESNITSDGPEFTKTRENVTKIKDLEQTTIKKAEDMSSDEYLENKAKELNLNNYYSNLFVKTIKENLKIQDDTNKIKEVVSAYDNWLDSITKVLDILTNNKSSWKISNSKIVFTSSPILIQYNTAVTGVTTAQISLKTKLLNISLGK